MNKRAVYPFARGWAVASLYFAEGWPYVLVNTASVVLLKDLGVTNEWIGLTSFFHLPWVLKMLWSPLIDGWGKTRSWVVGMQLAMGISLAASATLLSMGWGLGGVVLLFGILGLLSATHDIAVDGWYIRHLDEKTQARYVGMRVMMYRVAMVAGSGGIVMLAGMLQRSAWTTTQSWSLALAMAALLLLLLAFQHAPLLPWLERQESTEKTLPAASVVESPAASVVEAPAASAKEAPIDREDRAMEEAMGRWFAPFQAFFTQEGAGRIVAFILLYRLGEALLLKMVQPFLLDSAAKGGLALDTATVGLVYGTAGLIASIGGGIMGGIWIAKVGLRRAILPMMLLLNLPDLLYVLLAYFKPALPWIALCVTFEQWGYGIGFAAYTVVLMRIAGQSAHASSFFAIATALMALGLLLPGALSGWLQQKLGYGIFFACAFGISVFGMLAAFALPKRLWEETKKTA